IFQDLAEWDAVLGGDGDESGLGLCLDLGIELSVAARAVVVPLSHRSDSPDRVWPDQVPVRESGGCRYVPHLLDGWSRSRSGPRGESAEVGLGDLVEKLCSLRHHATLTS